MATVHYEADCRDDFDDSDEVTNNPFAVADSEHSDVARAASESSCRSCDGRSSLIATCGSRR